MRKNNKGKKGFKRWLGKNLTLKKYMKKRKIILNLAVSLDWYICDENGGFKWIVGDWDTSLDSKEQIDFFEFIKTIDTIVMWREAYNDCPTETMDSIFKNKKKYIVTHSNIENSWDDVEIINWDIVKQILEVQKQDWKNIYIYGWAKMVDAFIKADVIDEYIIGIIPTILWKGRTLFLENNPTIKLHLLEKSIKEGVVLLRYEKRKH